MKKTTHLLAACLVSLICSLYAFSQSTVQAEVVDVVDGKTVVLSVSNSRITVELQYVEAPLAGQQMHEAIKKHLGDLLIGKRVSYRAKSLMDDRSVGQIVSNGVDMSQQMLRDGAAWLMPSELSGQSREDHDLYAAREAEARRENRGIWSVAGLKPSWNREYAQVASTNPVRIPVATTKKEIKKPGKWGDKNPRLSEIGALFNGYNAPARTGYLSTGLFGFREMDGIVPFTAAKMAFDVTYLYKEERAGRKGTFTITILAASPTGYFGDRNELILYGDTSSTSLGKPKRVVTKEGDLVIETLRYEVSRASIDKMINTDGANLRVKDCVIYLTSMKYLLYNMLDVAK
jgi:endonuclease YncB( thermonuclease family)